MLKATAWPYPVFENVEFALDEAEFGGTPLVATESIDGPVVACGSLRDRVDGSILLKVTIKTSEKDVASHACPSGKTVKVKAGLRVLCKESKYRRFFPADPKGKVSAEIPLSKLRGVASIDVLFLSVGEYVAKNDVDVAAGSVIGVSPKKIVLAVDEDWTGETIPVDWLDFAAKQLPGEAFIHVEFSGGSQVPKVWLNSAVRSSTEATLLRKGDNSPVAIAGAALRQFFWLQTWEKIVVWAVREENFDEENWPATRIAKMWREKFREFDWDLPRVETLDADALNELSLHIQQCLLTAQNLTRIKGLLSLQPEAKGSS